MSRPAQAAAAADRRIDVRVELPSTAVAMVAGGIRFELRLKDLSRYGLCGLTDAPLAPGETVFLLFEEAAPVAAEIRWIRRALVGAAFAEPLPVPLLRKFGRKR